MYKEYLRPFLDGRDSETWHDHARNALHFAELNPINLKLLELFADKHRRFSDGKLKIVLAGIEFENPLMVGAGWDKKGNTVLAWNRLGAKVEIGTVVPRPQIGNDKPRQFIFNGDVCLNRLGFNSPGMDAVAQNLQPYKNSGIPIGVSAGKNKDTPNASASEDYALVVNKLYRYASYIAINVSSPNTKKLRELQGKDSLIDIVQAVKETMELKGGLKPIFIKIAPDLTNTAVDDVIQVVLDNNLSGLIATNTTINSDEKAKYGVESEAGGL